MAAILQVRRRAGGRCAQFILQKEPTGERGRVPVPRPLHAAPHRGFLGERPAARADAHGHAADRGLAGPRDRCVLAVALRSLFTVTDRHKGALTLSGGVKGARARARDPNPR